MPRVRSRSGGGWKGEGGRSSVPRAGRRGRRRRGADRTMMVGVVVAIWGCGSLRLPNPLII